jgi:hypothetical protein
MSALQRAIQRLEETNRAKAGLNMLELGKLLIDALRETEERLQALEAASKPK